MRGFARLGLGGVHRPFAQLDEVDGSEMWTAIPFKEAHVNKSLERTMIVI